MTHKDRSSIDKELEDNSQEIISSRKGQSQNSKRKPKKINLIEETTECDFLRYMKFNPKNQNDSSNLLVFASENEGFINKWLCVINYFLTK